MHSNGAGPKSELVAPACLSPASTAQAFTWANAQAEESPHQRVSGHLMLTVPAVKKPVCFSLIFSPAFSLASPGSTRGNKQAGLLTNQISHLKVILEKKNQECWGEKICSFSNLSVHLYCSQTPKAPGSWRDLLSVKQLRWVWMQ